MATVTTVIPTYRRPDLLRSAVTSVLAQSFRDLEVLVVDDASGDSTPAVVSELAGADPRVRYVCQPRNLGMMPNQASAVAMVCTPYFTILNDDDLLAPDFFGRAMESFKQHPSAAVFIGRLLYWDVETPDRTRTLCSFRRSGLYPPPTAAMELLRASQNHTWTSMMFRREVVDTLGGVDAAIGYAADLEFQLRVLAHYPAVVSHEPCAVYRLSASSGSFEDWLTPYLPSMRAIMTKIAADATIEPSTRRRIGQALAHEFRARTLSGAARALSLNELAPARRAADVLKGDLRAPIAARAIRIAARTGFEGRALRLGLRSIKVARRRVRRDPKVENYLEFVASILRRFDNARESGLTAN